MSVLSDKLNLIWYGDFEDHQNDPCKSFPLADQPAIKRVYRTDNNVWPTYRKGAANNPFDTLECGYAYIIEMESNQSVDIPHANVSNGNSSDPRGLLVAEVELTTPSPTPSPTPQPVTQVCIPDDYTKVDYAEGAGISLGDLGSGSFSEVGNLGYKSAEFPSSDGLPVLYFINIPSDSGNKLALAVVASLFPTAGSEPDIRFEADNGNCYGGKLVKNSDDDNWTANLTLLFTGSVPTPTPTPSPSPTPAPSVCGKPDDETYGTFDLATAAANEVTTTGPHRESNGLPQLVDQGDFDYMKSIGIDDSALGADDYLTFTYRTSFGEARGEFIYSRKVDPRPASNYDGQTRETHYAFFEDQLPLEGDAGSLLGPTGACKFTISKFILGDDDLFLNLDGKCYKGTYASATDQTLRPDSISGLVPIIVFREV